MDELPENPEELLRYLKEKMENEIPKLHWHTNRSLGSWTAKGYEDEKKRFKKEEIRVVIYNKADRTDIFVYDSKYFPDADKLSQRIREGSVFGDGVIAEIERGY